MAFGNKKSDVVEPARRLANHLTELRLMEKGSQRWKMHIWENLGWHFAAISPCGRWKVHPHYDWKTGKVRSYSAFLGEKGSAGGWWAESAKTAREAIVATAEKAYADVAQRASFLDIPIPPRKYA